MSFDVVHASSDIERRRSARVAHPTHGTLAVYLVVVLALGHGCSLVPLQARRVDAVLHYRQYYQLDHLLRLDPDGNDFGSRLVTAAIGQNNYCYLQDDARVAYQKELLSTGTDRWNVNGLATAVMSPSPWWSDGFLFEAHGRLLIRNRSKMIATSDFYVAAQSVFDVKELFAGARNPTNGDHQVDLRWIDLLIRQVIIREVDLGNSETDKRSIQESDAVLRLYLMPLTADGVFTIAPVKHEIGVMSSIESDSVYSVGCVDFDGAADGAQLFDVRKRDSILFAKDYPEMLRRAGIQPHSETFSPHWYGQPCAAREHRAEYRTAAERSAREWQRDPDGVWLAHLFERPDCVRSQPLSTRPMPPD